MLSGPECWAWFPGNESGEAAGNPDSHSLHGPQRRLPMRIAMPRGQHAGTAASAAY